MTGRLALAALALALVAGAGIYLRTAQRVSPVVGSLDAYRTPAARARAASPTTTLTRMVERDVVPFGTRVVSSPELVRGESRVLRTGRNGVVRYVYSVRSTGAGVIALRLVARDVLRRPEPRVVAQGTAPPVLTEGIATWYERDGMVAAHPTLPMGTSVVVTDLATGKSVTVIIDDRGPFGPGRIIDLSDDAFARLAPLSRGTVRVSIAW